MIKKIDFLKPTEIHITELANRYHNHPGPYAITEDDLRVLFPGIESADSIAIIDHVKGDTATANYVLIMRLVKHLQPKTVLEIGTFRGKTTLGLATYAPSNSVIITVALPKELVTGSEHNYGTDLAYFLKKNEIGTVYRNTPEENKIRQVYADSYSHECESAIGKLLNGQKIDFAFVDGAHDYESVKHDFEILVLPRLAENGVVIFDDYGNLATQPGVASYITQRAREKHTLFYWYVPFTPPDERNSTCIIYMHTKEALRYRWDKSEE